jgi:FKBP-type peptidyl-prolyl cis-trans isomerase
MKYGLFFLIALLSVLVACKQEEKTISGYKIKRHLTGNGKKAQVGDYAFVNVDIYYDDSLGNTTRQMGKPIPVNIPDLSNVTEEDRKSGKANPLTEAVILMGIGDSISVYIPLDAEMKKMPHLAKYTNMTYTIAMVDLKTEAEYQANLESERAALTQQMEASKAQESEIAAQVAQIAKDYKGGALKSKIQTTASGLKYLILEEGTGATPKSGAPVSVHYYGALTDGKMFDNSYQRGKPFKFNIGQGQVIKGWDEGIGLLKEGTKAVLFIPAELGYGAGGSGSIPPNSELIFHVFLEKAGM